ncbi:Fe-S osidoreductase [uncultured Desulfobacterium sp.]|uniref:Fe-S osidoreductase n=1 Tax=uncultured Desulfobacterium sp. TaxID=201089 RepID=A0A445MWU8_9BACT|nr:Fe-S osidoreductase [uncultured Desulfobacterium sp.]
MIIGYGTIKTIAVVIALILSVGYFSWRVNHLLRLLMIGKEENRFDRVSARLWMALKQSIFQSSQFRVPKPDYTYAGIMHILIIFGFLILLPGELEFIISGIIDGFSFSFLGERLFNIFLLSQDLFIAAVLAAMVMAFFRRFVLRPAQINYHLTAYVILSCICVLMLTLLGMNSLRFTNPEEVHFAGVAARWMPITTSFVSVTGLTNFYPVTFEVMWWLHLAVLLFFLDYIPNSKHLHVFAGIPANFFRHFSPPLIKLQPINFEAEELSSLGVSKVEDFTWKQLFDGYTCTECGRCTDQCPANNTGKALSPRDIILSIKENLFANGRMLLSTPPDQRNGAERVELIGGSIEKDQLWQCTTCGACANVCPVGNEHLRAVLEMRRYLMMEEGDAPELMSRAVKSLEARSHPFFGTGAGPKDWRKGLDVPIFEKGKSEYLLWVGCANIYEDRGQDIARAMIRVLKKAQVSFGILEESRCTGDIAKQMGNELLFNELAQQNIEDFASVGVSKIITLCPHCYNSFTYYYPEVGGVYEVIPHVIFINRLISSGVLSLKKNQRTIAYHDPCYLARHNGMVTEPREVVSVLGNLVEAPRNMKSGFCCGGGGGNYWAEEEGVKINHARAKELFETGAEFIATACPFCLLMMTDGLKKVTEEKKAYDIVELVDL